MIQVNIGGGQIVKIPEEVVHYYATIPSETEEQELINDVLHNQTTGLVQQPILNTNNNNRHTRYRNTEQQPNQQTLMQYRTPHERDLSKIISAWKLTFSGKEKENIEEFLLRVKEHRKIAALTDAELMRAVPMLLQTRVKLLQNE